MNITKQALSEMIAQAVAAAMTAPAIAEIVPQNVAGIAPAYVPAPERKRELTPSMVNSVLSFLRQNPKPGAWNWTANNEAKTLFAKLEMAIEKSPFNAEKETPRQYGERVLLPIAGSVQLFGDRLNAFIAAARKMEANGTKPTTRLVKSGKHTAEKWRP